MCDTYEDGHCLHIELLIAQLIAFLFALFHCDRVQKPQFWQSDQKFFSKSLKNASLNVAGSSKQQPQPISGLLDHSLLE